MTRVSEREIKAVLKLEGDGRFKRFVKSVVDAEQAWGLWDDGWALLEDDAGAQVFPLWPAKDYAELCRDPDWTNYVPAAIPLDDLLNDLLPKLQSHRVLAGVFPTPNGRGVTHQPSILEEALREELKKYE